MKKQLPDITLDDKYRCRQGRVFISGTQALVRLPMLQRELDQMAGLNTAGYISGYRGSPMGNYDAALWSQRASLEEAGVTFEPGVNEDLAATAIWGTQQIEVTGQETVAGVFALWYGKGPGVDRCGDVFKHGNYAGTHRHGGVLVVYGDDHPGKSSTVAHQSEQALAANQMPSLYPSNIQEFIEYGVLGWALSRYCGLWVGFKCVNETVEQTATIDIDVGRLAITSPDRGDMGQEVNYRPVFRHPQENEVTVKRLRLPLVHRFVRANRIDRRVFDSPLTTLGIVTAGKSYQDVLHALSLLDIDMERARDLGLDVYKVGCIWPLEPEGITDFALGCRELLFIEEKSPFLEHQAAAILYDLEKRPRITGKGNGDGKVLLPSDVQLSPREIAEIIAARLAALNRADPALQSTLTALRVGAGSGVETGNAGSLSRLPYFCSGCPHNRSTVIPPGSMAMAGIGCHAMAVYTRKDTVVPTHMGGEGLNWVGMRHFTRTAHVFQNLGDGTYYHSGLMAIRAAVASGANITYKILYNDAVAMTGGQPVDGPLSVGDISRQVVDEGVKKCVLITDNPAAYYKAGALAKGVEVFHRDELDRVQCDLRRQAGCTVLIYEQTCAAEKRRRRKRGDCPDPARRLYINTAVCEGCGDCSVQSTCVSIQPQDTPLGTKRQIDQVGCNKDYSCANGFCPSFVTVLGAEPRKPREAGIAESVIARLPDPKRARLGRGSYGIMIAGIGGTGVITVGALLGMAAHLEGLACSIFDMTGLSQKNGAVYSHLRIAATNREISAPRIGAGEADLVLAFDLVAALSGDAEPTYARGFTRVVGNIEVTPTASFQFRPASRPDNRLLRDQLAERVGEHGCDLVDATGFATELVGDTVGANLFLVGYAAQKGRLPVSVAAITKAVELNGVAVPFNLKAFNLGRLWAHAPEELLPLLKTSAVATPQDHCIDRLIEHRCALLTDYQNTAYADRYRRLVEQVRNLDKKLGRKSELLTGAVARNYAKLMAYKDEYEVARLYVEPAFVAKLQATFGENYKLRIHLAPPLLSGRDPHTGHLRKREFGPWIFAVFKVLCRLKGLRGTRFDIFGYTAERRQERQLVIEYEQTVEQLLEVVNNDNYFIAVELASLPDRIRGFGHVKEKSIAEVKNRWGQLLRTLHHADSTEQTQVVKILS